MPPSALRPVLYFNTSLALTEDDSAPSSGGRVIWQAEAGATAMPRVYGGARVTGWTPSKKHPTGSGIWQAVLPKELVDSEGRALFRTLVQDERSAWLARTPNFGSGYLPCGGGNSSFSCASGVLPAGFDCQLGGPGASGANNATSACSVFMRAGYSSDLRAVTGVATNPTTKAVSVTFYYPGSGARGDFYIQGALEFLDQEGEWAVCHGILYYWPYSTQGEFLSPESFTMTAPVTQRVISFVGSSQAKRARGLTLSGLRIIGSSMPQTYIFMCRGNGPGASPHGAPCGADGGPDTVDETNTSPREASQGMIYMENASDITVRNCALRAAWIAGFWFEEANENHTVEGNWVQDIAGFGLYSNGVEGGDRRYTGLEGDNNHGHTIHNNIFVDGGRQIVYGTGVWLYQTGSTSITHNVIHRFSRDGVGFYGTLPFWTAEPGGKVAPGMPAASPGARTPWGKYISWNGGKLANGNVSWSTWDILFNKNNYLGYNDISSCNREGLDGGVIESWGSSINNTWEANAVHDNEGYGGLSLLFADDFTPSLTEQEHCVRCVREQLPDCERQLRDLHDEVCQHVDSQQRRR